MSTVPEGSGEVLLVGAGAVAVAHAHALQHLGVHPVVVGRRETSAAAFEAQTGLPVRRGGLAALLDGGSPVPAQAVVAVPVPDLAGVTTALLRAGVRRVLVEKPGGLDRGEVAAVAALARERAAAVHVAYNRRFHVATREARRLIAADGGVRSFTFDFTERSAVVAALPAPARVKEEWLIANSSHVVDLAFHLGGEPVALHAESAGSTPWHRRGAVFAGSGRTAQGALFSYVADWGAPGRWRLELVTEHRRLLLQPLERLQVSERGDAAPRLHEADYSVDDAFKPGFVEQARSFLGTGEHLVDVHDQVRALDRVLLPIRGGA